jgi:hypothetical protein
VEVQTKVYVRGEWWWFYVDFQLWQAHHCNQYICQWKTIIKCLPVVNGRPIL